MERKIIATPIRCCASFSTKHIGPIVCTDTLLGSILHIHEVHRAFNVPAVSDAWCISIRRCTYPNFSAGDSPLSSSYLSRPSVLIDEACELPPSWNTAACNLSFYCALTSELITSTPLLCFITFGGTKNRNSSYVNRARDNSARMLRHLGGGVFTLRTELQRFKGQ